MAAGIVAMLSGLAAIVLENQAPQLVSLARTVPTSHGSQPLASTSSSAAPSSQVPRSNFLPSTNGPNAAAAQAATVPVARLTIPKLGIRNAPIYDRATDSKGNLLIAAGYAVTHYSFSAPFGAGNAVIYGHDDIQGSIFGHLYDLAPGDIIQIKIGGQTQGYRVIGHQIVPPTALAVMDPTPDVRLTLITCWPYNVDTKRWIVTAMKA